MKKVFAFILVCAMALSTVACGNGSAVKNETKTINIAYQYGLAYAPVIIAQKNELIEKAYKEATGNDVTVVWTQMSSGADINTGIASGNVQAGFMGIAPAITGVSKKVGYKVFTGLSGQEHGMMSNDPSITSLGDLVGSDKQIALVNIGSIQHLILARALSENGYDAHALDSNIVAMKHPDGKNAVETGNVSCHLTSNPYIYMERESGDLNELPEIKASWSADNSFIVGVASETLYESDPELYKALCKAISDAIDTINADKAAAAAITCEYDGNDVENELKYMEYGSYSVKTKGLTDLASFMYENAFLDNEISGYSDLVFDNVTGD